ncbi:MAG: VacB/RNase II family 3'-5' exoribonuclease, partial [Gallicola sp.]|nr:VacB/RNase II family 3'-5' exoribonuclease [Gallicola sp.]
IEVEGRDDIFIPEGELNTAMDGDTVVVTIKEAVQEGKRAEGEIQRVVSRAIKTVVGVFDRDKTFGFVVPDNRKIHQDIFIREDHFSNARNGQKVVVSITKYGEKNRNPEGKIIEILGYPDEKGVDVLSVALERNIRMEFPKEVLAEAMDMPQEVRESDLEGREDFRDELIFTIDGPDAKDLDDAISIEKIDGDIYRMGVHIADVTHYVRENSPLDKEARLRGTSVYLIDRVIPMLPKELSNGICSLNPGVDRLTLSVIMDINKNGKVINSKIINGVIRSKRRLIYETVSDLLEHDSEEAKSELGELVEPIRHMHELMKILNHKREVSGAIDFDFEESKIELDENGKVLDIHKDERRVGNRLIEEFMLITN